ncbi:MAG: chorismate-binding protein [Flavobacteriales bacterium]|nr:chorismate-binding protein [Flavobacteriales bacterium]
MNGRLNSITTLNAENYLIYRRPLSEEVQYFALGDPHEFSPGRFKEEHCVLVGDHSGRHIKVYPIIEQMVLDPGSLSLTETDRKARPGLERDFWALDWWEEYAALVKKAVHVIRGTSLEKVVLSASYDVESTRDPIDVFRDLLSKHGDAHCFIMQIDGVGMWLGASPEQLFVRKKEEVELMALAGTRPGGTNDSWGAKEIDEQNVVVRDMVEVLERCGYGHIQVSERESRRSGAMEHICTYIRATEKYPDSWMKLLRALHPSPALMGYPREMARHFLIANELVDRSFFTGFFGVHSGDITELAVMIRCARYRDGVYTLFAGAGINRDSVPDREVRELEAKFNLMQEVIPSLRS